MIALAVFFGLIIFMSGSSFAAIQGRFAQQLEIPGSAAIPHIPWITLAAYILVVVVISATKKSRIRWCSFVVATLVGNLLIAYPVLLLNRGSKVIITEYPIARQDLASFKARFPVLVTSYSGPSGHVIRVRNDQYSQDMPGYFDQLTKKNLNKAQMAPPRRPSD